MAMEADLREDATNADLRTGTADSRMVEGVDLERSDAAAAGSWTGATRVSWSYSTSTGGPPSGSWTAKRRFA